MEFRDRLGAPIPEPQEWQPASVVLPVLAEDFLDVEMTVNGRRVPLAVVQIDHQPRVTATWDRSGPGWYDAEVRVAGDIVLSRRFRISPSKIHGAAFERMLFDLEARLPVTVAIALRAAGARIGVTLQAPQQETLATELARLRSAVWGVDRTGLAEALRRISDDPHRVLLNEGEWVRTRQARRPDPRALVQAVANLSNLEGGRPKRVLDQRVVHSTDVYENRLLKAFSVEVMNRLRRLRSILKETERLEVRAEVEAMLESMVSATRQAAFLDEVGRLRSSPSRPTMVLMRRPEYRSAYEAFLEFRRRRSVYLAHPEVDEPLRNLPYLYQLWSTLVVIQATAETLVEHDWRVDTQQLVVPAALGLYLYVLRNGRPALVMHDQRGRRLRLVPEMSFKSRGRLQSLSFSQRPDITIELIEGGSSRLLVLDPKYKLDSESAESTSDGKPKKDDIDKMHAYRDAIRDSSDRHVVKHAAILYPGSNIRYGSDISAVRSYPGDEEALKRAVAGLLLTLVNE